MSKLYREKYSHLCGQIDDERLDSSTATVDEDVSLVDGMVCSLRASPINPSRKNRTGIEDFEIIKPISRGAFGRVFLARKRITNDFFAIKVFSINIITCTSKTNTEDFVVSIIIFVNVLRLFFNRHNVSFLSIFNSFLGIFKFNVIYSYR